MADIPSTPADGNEKVMWVTTIANTSAPTAAELNAGSSVDLSCYLTGDGFNPGLDEGVITDNRLCETETFEQPGRAQRSLSLTYIHNVNTILLNAAYTSLVPGTAGYIVRRAGKAFDTTFAAADKVEVWPVKAGKRSKLPPEANSVNRVTQKMFVTARVIEDATVA
jgi:hypothetical protein